MRSIPAQRAEKKRLHELADQFAYEGATRVDARAVIPTSAGLRAVVQAVYTTPDTLDFVDFWYRQQLGFTDSLPPSAGVKFSVGGVRLSFFRDGLTYRKAPVLKRRKMTVRQYVFEAGGARLVVLACRQPDAPVTQIAITVLPGESAADAEPGAAP